MKQHSERIIEARDYFLAGAEPGSLHYGYAAAISDLVEQYEVATQRIDLLEDCDCVPAVVSSKGCRKCGRRGIITQEHFMRIVKDYESIKEQYENMRAGRNSLAGAVQRLEDENNGLEEQLETARDRLQRIRQLCAEGHGGDLIAETTGISFPARRPEVSEREVSRPDDASRGSMASRSETSDPASSLPEYVELEGTLMDGLEDEPTPATEPCPHCGFTGPYGGHVCEPVRCECDDPENCRYATAEEHVPAKKPSAHEVWMRTLPGTPPPEPT